MSNLNHKFFKDEHTINNEQRDSAKSSLKREKFLNKILGKSTAIRDLRDNIKRIAYFNVNVLITGASGTGKELVAKAIHGLSNRARMPFIPVNCGSIPENLFENELFGHVKGAFTGASYHQIGLVQAANNGTLFLDEIDSISLHIQVKLLRLLENYEYKPLGDSQPHKANIRIIAATNRSLNSMVKTGSFRDDLLFRLKIVHLHIPPLIERKEDIPLLAEFFFRKYINEYNKKNMKLTDDALNYLVSYPWKGNIRELENMIQNLIIMSKSDVLEVQNLRVEDEADIGQIPFKVAKMKAINSFEINYLTRILKENNGNVAKAAKKAEKGRTALWNLIKKHNIDPKTFRF